MNFHENPSSGYRVAPRGRAGGRTDRRTVGHEAVNSRSCNFTKAPKNRKIFMEAVLT
jgi:hypothetical protein